MSNGVASDSVWAIASKVHKWPLFLGIFLVAVGLTILSHFDIKQLWHKVAIAGLAEIGFAFIIAFILSITIEYQSRKEFQKEITERETRLAKNIFDYIYSIRTERSVFRLIEEKIFKESFLRRGMDIRFHFGDVVGDWVNVRAEFCFKLENISHNKKDYDVVFFYEKPMGVTAVPAGVKSGISMLFIDRQYSEEEISEINKNFPDDKRFMNFKKTISVEPNRPVDIKIFANLPKRVRDVEVWRTFTATDSLTVNVFYDKNIFDLNHDLLHPSKDFSQVLDHDDGLTLHLPDALLPSNGVFLWWCRKELGQHAIDGSIISTVPDEAGRGSSGKVA